MADADPPSPPRLQPGERMLDFSGQVVVVIGAGGNPGAAITRTLARQDASGRMARIGG